MQSLSVHLLELKKKIIWGLHTNSQVQCTEFLGSLLKCRFLGTPHMSKGRTYQPALQATSQFAFWKCYSGCWFLLCPPPRGPAADCFWALCLGTQEFLNWPYTCQQW